MDAELLVPLVADAAPTPAVMVAVEPGPVPEAVAAAVHAGLSDVRFWQGMSVLTFGLITLLVVAWLLRARRASSGTVIKAIGLIMVVTVAAFMATTGYAGTELNTIVQLLSTIVGLLFSRLGRDDGKTDGGEAK